MIAWLGRQLSNAFARLIPDPFVLAVLLTLLTVVLVWWKGDFADPEATSRAGQIIDAWRSPGSGLWRFLAFGMQMCLVLVTGFALAESKPVRAVLRKLSGLPNSSASAAAMIAGIAMAAGLVNWGLGLIVGAFLARDVARGLEARGIPVHAPLLAAAGYTAMLVWHGGLSGSAPLKMTTPEEAATVLPTETLVRLSETGATAIPLTETVFSPMNLFVSGGLLLIIPALLFMLTPKSGEGAEPMPFTEDLFEDPPTPIRSLPDFLDRSPVVPVSLAVLIVWALWRFTTRTGWASAGLNEINGAMLALGLLFHGSANSYIASIERGARGCAGIILQFPLYGGIMGMLAASGLIDVFSSWMSSQANATTLPILTFLSAGAVNIFVPSGGGQWAIQGPLALQAGQDLGIEPAKMIMSVAYGDQLTNMLQPFWAIPLLAITGVRARDIVGYTAIVMLAAMGWIAIGLLLF